MSILSTFKKQNLHESNLDIIKAVGSGNGSAEKLKFEDGQSLHLDNVTAKMLLVIYNATKQPENKEKFERMVTQSSTSFMKLVDFGWKQVK